MPRTAQEIRDFYKEAHDILTEQYYSDKDNFPGGKEAYDQAHAEVWRTMDQELLASGYLKPAGPSLEERVAALEERFK
jgi:hypothetical protein